MFTEELYSAVSENRRKKLQIFVVKQKYDKVKEYLNKYGIRYYIRYHVFFYVIFITCSSLVFSLKINDFVWISKT